MTAKAYPLAWPEDWSRTPPHEQESGRQFTHQGEPVTISRAYFLLDDELRQLGAEHIVISTNHKPDDDGVPFESRHRLRDEGVAIYFVRDGKVLAMACDRYTTAAANLRSLGLAINAMRTLDRHGGGTMAQRAFSGFLAITGPSWKKPWRQVFGVDEDWHGDIAALFRIKARQRHPDMGGSDALMAELNAAFAEAKQELGTEESQRLTAKQES